jgi:glycerophosphoryl diester phosphodiesterase
MRIGMKGRLALALVVALISGSIAATLSPSAGAVAPDPNPWLQNRFLNMAHQGGEDEAPSNTLFAFKSAIRDRGADTLELDVNLSADGDLMVIHDDTVNRTTQESADRASGLSEVNDLTTAQVQALDAGYTFRPGHYDKSEPASSYPYRGVRTGQQPPPAGYSADDFRIPTLREVLDAFPNTPINIEIKMIKTTTGMAGGCTNTVPAYCDDPTASIPVADALANLLDEPQYASRNDIIVVSFSDQLIDEFHAQDQDGNVALAPGVDDTTDFALAGTTPDPDVAALQVPPEQLGIDVPKLLLQVRNAHDLGYAVHVWTNGDQDETDTSYRHLYDLGVDGIMSSDPSRLAAFLCANHIARPDGSDRCPAPQPSAPLKKKCKKKRHKSKRAAASKKKHRCHKHKKHKKKRR